MDVDASLLARMLAQPACLDARWEEALACAWELVPFLGLALRLVKAHGATVAPRRCRPQRNCRILRTSTTCLGEAAPMACQPDRQAGCLALVYCTSWQW